jgi:hypothetical protein
MKKRRIYKFLCENCHIYTKAEAEKIVEKGARYYIALCFCEKCQGHTRVRVRFRIKEPTIHPDPKTLLGGFKKDNKDPPQQSSTKDPFLL